MNPAYPNQQSRQNQNRHGGGQYRNSFSPLSEDVLKKIIWVGDSKTLVEESEKLGRHFAESQLTTTQIRAIFSEVRQIEGLAQITDQKEVAFRRLYLLKPKMKYRAGKEKGSVKDLVDGVLDPALTLVFSEDDKREERFKRFAEFFEAILAYHKYNGGK